MIKKIIVFLALGVLLILLIPTSIFDYPRYLYGDTRIDWTNDKFSFSQSPLLISARPNKKNSAAVDSLDNELKDIILISAGWQEHIWKCKLNSIKVCTKNNGTKTVFCEIIKSDGTYLGAGRNFTLKPGQSHVFIRNSGPGEYKIYVYNSDGSKLNVFVGK